MGGDPMVMLAWRPFLDPIDAHGYWWAFLLPLALLISITYRAVRTNAVPGGAVYWKQVFTMTFQIVAAMVALGAASYVLVEWVLERVAPMV